MRLEPMDAVHGAMIAPFVEFAFMRRALVACVALALGCAPIGVFLILRRMSLVGDALSHAILPGVAAGFLIAGLSLGAMALGGFAAALLTAMAAGAVSRFTGMREDAAFAAFYLLAIASGVVMISASGARIDLLHVLFGSVLGVDTPSLLLVAGVSTVSILCVAMFFRGFVIECFDPEFLRQTGGQGGVLHGLFLILLCANLVAAFQALGTLMSVGLMMLPAAAARFWARSIAGLIATAALIGVGSAYAGLVVSFALDAPSGPSIILVAGLAYLASLIFGPLGGAMVRLLPRHHLEA